MRYEDRTVQGVADLVRLLKDDGAGLQNDTELNPDKAPYVPVWFRGLSDTEYSLKTTMAREGALDSEGALVNRFKQNAHQFLDRIPQNPWEWLFLMRHYGLPSRLLDWTESALVGLYFAVQPTTEFKGNQSDSQAAGEPDGALWCLLPTALNKLSQFHSKGPLDIPMFEDEKSDFFLYLPESMRGPTAPTGVLPVAGIAMRGSERMQAQQGVFTITHRDQTPIEDVGDRDHIWRFVVPSGCKEDIRDDLHRLGVTPLTIFPGLDNVALMAKRALDV